MSVITFDFAESRRSREEYLIALAAAVQETITGEIAAGTRGQLVGCGVIGAANSEAPITVPTLAEALGMEKVPAQKLSARAQKLATIPREADPVVFGGMTPADLLDCEAECQCQEGGTRYSSYRFAVGAVHAKPGKRSTPISTSTRPATIARSNGRAGISRK